MNFKCKACLSNSNEIFIKHPKDREYFSKRLKPAKIIRCLNCQSYNQYPWPKTEELNKLYSDDYQNYVSSKIPFLSFLVKQYTKYSAKLFIKTYGKGKIILDFGCGQGVFLKSLLDEGVEDLYGFDFVEYEENKDFRDINFYYSLDDIKLLTKKFDIIRLNHVIEHFCDLDFTIKILLTLLKDDGLIIGQTPNANHYTSKLWRDFWGNLHYPYHTIIFSKKGLSVLFERHESKLIKTVGTNLTNGWALSIENFIKEKLRLKVRGRTFFYIFLILISFPISTLDHLIRPRGSANFNFFVKKK